MRWGFEFIKALAGKRAAEKSSESDDLLSRSRSPLGPLTAQFSGWQPGRVNATLYEALRENIGVIDRALRLLVTFDGIIRIEGKNQKLVDEITEWGKHVRVNDTEFGLQAFINNLSNEAYEQGHSVAQYVASPSLDDIARLVVADSKDIIYLRGTNGLDIWYRPALPVFGINRSSTERVQDILQGKYNPSELLGKMAGIGYAKVEGDNVIPYSVNNENQNPYGTSFLRSTLFAAKNLLTIHNSVRLNWERYGDPAYFIKYKGSKGDMGEATMAARLSAITKSFNLVMDAKKKGTSADFVQAIGKDSDLTIEIIGAEGKVMQMEIPARAMLEQIISSTSIPPNLLGLQWSSTERNAQFQVEVALNEGFIRSSLKNALVERLIMALLRLRGRSWRPGDWRVVFDQPNLHDLVAQAQANFLNAQADQMRAGATPAPPPAKTVTVHSCGGSHLSAKLSDHRAKFLDAVMSGHRHAGKSETPNPVSAPLVDEFSAALIDRWKAALANYLRPLIPKGKTLANDNARMRAEIMAYINEVNANTRMVQGPVAKYVSRGYSLGVVNAAKAAGSDTALLDPSVIAEESAALYGSSMQLVKDTALATLKDKINPVLAEMHGQPPEDVARALTALFEGASSYWDMFARSEITMALELGKKAEWEVQGINKLGFVPAPGACSVCVSYAGTYPIAECPVPARDTHPNCTCSTTIATEV